MSEKNKVKYSLRNAYYAEQIEGVDGEITFATPIRYPGAVSISLGAQGDVSPFYADGIVYYQTAANNGYEGDMEAALVPEDFRIKILGEELDGKKVLVERSNARQTMFAFLFEFEGDKKAIRHVFYNCSATRPSVESSTREDTIEPVTETLTITATPMASGLVKARTGNDTESSTYADWYNVVYLPSDEEEEE